MSILKKTGLSCLAISLGVGINSGALAADAESTQAQLASGNEWVRAELNESKAARKARGGRTYIPSEWVYSTDTGSNGAAIVCSGKRLSLIVATEPQDMSVLFNGQSKGRKMNRPMNLFIDGENVSKAQWFVRPRKGLASAQDQKIIRKIYNAAIRGQTVAISRKSNGPKTELSLPKVNNDFADFGGPCGIGRNK